MSLDSRKKPERGKSHRRAVAEGKLVETANDLSTSKFMQIHAPPELLCANASKHTFNWTDGTNIDKRNLESCLNLVEQTSVHDYEHSELGWSRTKKRKEMVLPDLKYILLFKSEPSCTSADVQQGALHGFVSFMITYEDGHEVIYIYEIHFVSEFQGKGYGRTFVSHVEAIGRNAGVEKAMLTVFRSNTRAVSWYAKLGYVEDEFSPGPRKLRNGTVKEPTYAILSKMLGDVAG